MEIKKSFWIDLVGIIEWDFVRLFFVRDIDDFYCLVSIIIGLGIVLWEYVW